MKECVCKNCGSKNLSLYTRITGYFSKLTSWNSSKQEELKQRRKGNYKIG